VPTTRPRHRFWFVLTITGVAVIAFAGAVGIFFLGLNFTVAQLQPVGPDQPLVVGAPAEPVAASPLPCPVECFTPATIRETLPYNRAFAELGVPDTVHPYGTYEDSTAGEQYRYGTSWWAEANGGPDTCFFVEAGAPYASSTLSPDKRSADPIYFIGTHANGENGDTLDQAVRLFPDSDAAEAYLGDLAASIDACDNMSIAVDGYVYRARVDPASALGTPASVASAGWIRTGDPGEGWRAYSFDLQRGNMVVRTTLFTDGTIRETDFRRFVQKYAAQLANLEPPGP